ncbi:rna-directed dna polymerase from mobile element jockey-like [Willisornis vidua]|uniref:Rna-directed dna polymerase from mobile element jockey-like n=1 Tax=Willisornis vidua TaxID=1566151 RepID=A0ABQ9CXS3_9PASS|nr:rna-directed dna polymerase from mobile element jockey-like [Willisornis vidua]
MVDWYTNTNSLGCSQSAEEMEILNERHSKKEKEQNNSKASRICSPRKSCYSGQDPYWDLFNVLINDIECGIECSLSKFADDTRREAVDLLEGRIGIQSGIDRLEERAHANLMKFNKSKCKVLYLGEGNPRYEYSLGEKWLKAALWRRT